MPSGFRNGILGAYNVDFTGNSIFTPQVVADGQIFIGSTVAPNIRVGTLTSTGGSLTISSGAGTINIEAGGSLASTYHTGSGNAAPVAGIINILGGSGVSTSGAGNTITINGVPVNQNNIIYVAKSGNDGFNGRSIEQAKLTFGAAITAATALVPSAVNRIAIVCYDDGIYTENVITNVRYVDIYAPNAKIEGQLIMASDSTVKIREIDQDYTVTLNTSTVYFNTVTNSTFEAERVGVRLGLGNADVFEVVGSTCWIKFKSVISTCSANNIILSTGGSVVYVDFDEVDVNVSFFTAETTTAYVYGKYYHAATGICFVDFSGDFNAYAIIDRIDCQYITTFAEAGSSLNLTGSKILGGNSPLTDKVYINQSYNTPTVIYVSKGGNLTNIGNTPSQSLPTFASALTLAATLTPTAVNRISIVCLDNGVYAESITGVEYVDIYAPNATLGRRVIGASNTDLKFYSIYSSVADDGALYYDSQSNFSVECTILGALKSGANTYVANIKDASGQIKFKELLSTTAADQIFYAVNGTTGTVYIDFDKCDLAAKKFYNGAGQTLYINGSFSNCSTFIEANVIHAANAIYGKVNRINSTALINIGASTVKLEGSEITGTITTAGNAVVDVLTPSGSRGVLKTAERTFTLQNDQQSMHVYQQCSPSTALYNMWTMTNDTFNYTIGQDTNKERLVFALGTTVDSATGFFEVGPASGVFNVNSVSIPGALGFGSDNAVTFSVTNISDKPESSSLIYQASDTGDAFTTYLLNQSGTPTCTMHGLEFDTREYQIRTQATYGDNLNGDVALSIGSTGAYCYEEITAATKTITINRVYGANRGGGIAFTLPAAAAVGTFVKILGINGLWDIQQGAGQSIRFGNITTTAGAGHGLIATSVGDCVELTCIVADTMWIVSAGPQGAPDTY